MVNSTTRVGMELLIYTIIAKYIFKQFNTARILYIFTRSQDSGFLANSEVLAREYIDSIWNGANFTEPKPTQYYAFEKDIPSNV